MYSQTLIGRDIFAAIWGLGVMGAVAQAVDSLGFPFDAQLREFAAAHKEDLSRLWREIGRFSGLSNDVVKIAVEEAPWAEGAIRYPDADSIKMELVLASPGVEHTIGASEFQALTLDRDNLRRACLTLLARLLDSTLSAHWAFCSDAQSGREAWPDVKGRLEDIWGQILPLVRGAGLESEPLFLLTYRIWRSSLAESAESENTVEEYRRYVAAWIAYMDQLGSPESDSSR